MSADVKKSGLFAFLSKLKIVLEIALGFFVPSLVMFVFIVGWARQQPLERRIFSDGTVEVRENSLVLIVMLMLILSVVIFGVAVLWRRRWRRLAPAGIGSLFMGGLYGWLWISLLAGSGVMMFTPAGVTISAPAWLGGETRAKLVYLQIDWLGTRDRIQWKRDRRQERWWMKGAEPAWQRVKIPEYLVKMKGGEETQVDMSRTVKGAWDEILKAARSAGVTVKPVERIILPKPTD